uniref:Uncharacterized protein n=1 Tax=Tetranychus urticae TaxID=32264 RepID=T1L5D4_TETUR
MIIRVTPVGNKCQTTQRCLHDCTEHAQSKAPATIKVLPVKQRYKVSNAIIRKMPLIFNRTTTLMVKCNDPLCPFVAPCNGYQDYTKKMHIRIYHNGVEDGVTFTEARIPTSEFRRLSDKFSRCNRLIMRAKRRESPSEWRANKAEIIREVINRGPALLVRMGEMNILLKLIPQVYRQHTRSPVRISPSVIN